MPDFTLCDHTPPSPTSGYLGLLLETGKNFGTESREALLESVSRLRPEMFLTLERDLFEASVDLLSMGRIPSPGSLRDMVRSLNEAEVRRLLSSGEAYGDLESAARAVQVEHDTRILLEGITKAQQATLEGRLEYARGVLGDLGDAASSAAPLESLALFRDFEFDFTRDARILTPFPSLNNVLGGGLGYQGKLALSLTVAASGVGKSSFWQQMCPWFMSQGHWVLYCAGEASHTDVHTDIVRLSAGETFHSLALLRDKGPAALPRTHRNLTESLERLKALPGTLMTMDEDFDGAKIRMTARALKRELLEAKRQYRAEESAQLIIIVDNLDHTIDWDERGGKMREDQMFNKEARRFYLDAKEFEYHCALLAQASSDSLNRDGAPWATDIAQAKATLRHAGVMVALHRPLNEEERSKTDRDGHPTGRAKTIVALRKARGGTLSDLEFDPPTPYGAWVDPGGNLK